MFVNQAPKKTPKKLCTQLFRKLSHPLFLYGLVIVWASILESVSPPTHNTSIHTHTHTHTHRVSVEVALAASLRVIRKRISNGYISRLLAPFLLLW